MGCPADPESAVQIATSSIATLYNVFPIKIGAVPVFPLPGVYDDPLEYPLPVCVCLLPFPRFGLTISNWEPIEIFEVVKIPFCFPSIGMDMPVDEIVSGLLMGGDSEQTLEQTSPSSDEKFLQVHEATFPVWKIVGLFEDFICLNLTGEMEEDIDLVYISEVDPFWQNDLLTAIFKQPETILFANPIAALACMADAAAASLPVIGRPINTLYWCMGTWGLVYPTTGHMGDLNLTSASVAMASRALYNSPTGKMVTTGIPLVSGSCQAYPASFWKKSQFSWLELYPVTQVLRMQVGRASITWSFLKNPPVPGKCDHFVWLLYRKVDCCAF
jgi:conjugal transfer pilus assembly protein TraU